MEYAQKNENRFTNALVTLGSRIPFKGESTMIKISKQQNSIIGTLKRMFPEDYTLIKGEIYRRLLGGILSKSINEKEGKLKLEELHS